MNSDSQVEANTQNLNQVKCCKGKEAVIVCSSKHCQHQTFICNDSTCQCRSHHQLCAELLISKIQQIILSHSYSPRPLQQKIETAFYQAIDKLSDQKDKILQQIKDKYQYIGLNQFQKKFIQVLKKGAQADEINCQFVWKIQNQLRGKKLINQKLIQMDQSILIIAEKFMKECQKFRDNFSRFLFEIEERQKSMMANEKELETKGINIYLKSKIVKSVDDQNKLIGFFTSKKVQSTTLLYRASQNQFLVQKFFQKCSHISDTMVIVETQFGKVIGGFTSYVWFKTDTSLYLNSVSNKDDHFLFSLTNNDKFSITQSVPKAIYLSSANMYGPCFGNQDFEICNKANQNSKSKANVNGTYKNSKYQSDTASQLMFAGALNFKIKQWEVWKLSFNP